MPLGLMPEMTYDEKEAVLEPGESLLLYSDGLVEAHDPGGEMFGFPRLRELMGRAASTSPVDGLLAELDRFTGPAWEQEDDITLLALERAPQPVGRREDERHRAGRVRAGEHSRQRARGDGKGGRRGGADSTLPPPPSTGCGPPSPKPR